ncbi:MAG: PHP domain-containing protein [Elusimicrobiota bacterium]|jgi:predicted metal-dependent phosphoesterase TrpH|nr:PHP domain-containing protein [Elusimicrobiota bacterium]
MKAKEKFADLHIHTICSDGSWTPRQAVEAAFDRNLSAIAITDHDNVDGIDEALEAGNEKGVEIIPGVELSSYLKGQENELHILGYYIDYKSPNLRKILDALREERLKRAENILRKLKENGVILKDDSFVKTAKRNSIGRLHFAKALLNEGFVSSIQEAFIKYLGYNSSAYVPKVMLPADEAINLIIQSGGIPVLAHPYSSRCNKDSIKQLIEYGLAGLEVWHIKHTSQMSKTFFDWAIELDLTATGGSDCHGNYDGKTPAIMGKLKISYTAVENLKKILKIRNDRNV